MTVFCKKRIQIQHQKNQKTDTLATIKIVDKFSSSCVVLIDYFNYLYPLI